MSVSRSHRVEILCYQMNNLGGIEHTEIRVFGQDFTFNAEGIGERIAQNRTDAENTLIRRIDCGFTDKSYRDLDTWIFYQKINRFVMLSYNISTNNCWHFSLALLQFLDPDNLYDGQDHLQSNIESAQMGRRVAHQVLGRDGAQLAETVVTLYNFANSDTAAASSQQCSIM